MRLKELREECQIRQYLFMVTRGTHSVRVCGMNHIGMWPRSAVDQLADAVENETNETNEQRPDIMIYISAESKRGQRLLMVKKVPAFSPSTHHLDHTNLLI